MRAVAFDSALGASQNIQIALQYYPWRADLMELAGQYAIQGGDSGTGIKLLQRASGYTQLSPASYVALGDGALMQQDVKLALQVWEIALRSGGDPYAIYTRMANAHRSLGNYPAAIADLEQAAELQPNNGQIQYQLGLLIATQDPEDAIGHLLRRGTGSGTGRNNQGHAARSKNSQPGRKQSLCLTLCWAKPGLLGEMGTGYGSLLSSDPAPA